MRQATAGGRATSRAATTAGAIRVAAGDVRRVGKLAYVVGELSAIDWRMCATLGMLGGVGVSLLAFVIAL